MKDFKYVEVLEKTLEDLIRQKPESIEEGLKYVDHQRHTDRGPLDVLMVDSGGALVVAELKVVEDDSMLFQGMDYYDYISGNIEGFARVYKDFNIDPKQEPRLFLIAPSISIALQKRCKWIDIPISLFTYKCIHFEGAPDDIAAIFSEITIPSTPIIEEEYSLNDRLNYITDDKIRGLAAELLKEIKDWDHLKITIDAIKYDVSLKVSGNVFAYFCPRRKSFLIYTYDSNNKWSPFTVNQREEVAQIKELLKTNVEKRK